MLTQATDQVETGSYVQAESIPMQEEDSPEPVSGIDQIEIDDHPARPTTR